jgi:hypothetical protein
MKTATVINPAPTVCYSPPYQDSKIVLDDRNIGGRQMLSYSHFKHSKAVFEQKSFISKDM